MRASDTHRGHAGAARSVLHGSSIAVDVCLSVTHDDIAWRWVRFLGYPVLCPPMVITLRLFELLWHCVIQRCDPIERLAWEGRILVGRKLLVSCCESGEGIGGDAARSESVSNGCAAESSFGAFRKFSQMQFSRQFQYLPSRECPVTTTMYPG